MIRGSIPMESVLYVIRFRTATQVTPRVERLLDVLRQLPLRLKLRLRLTLQQQPPANRRMLPLSRNGRILHGKRTPSNFSTLLARLIFTARLRDSQGNLSRGVSNFKGVIHGKSSTSNCTVCVSA